MGFFYKAGAAEGVTVVEGASYDALATSAKTQAHGTLMLDTSTGFYYKNWKTGGPGIPIPAEYFDNIGGYFSNASGNAYWQLSDSLSDLTSRGFATGGSPAAAPTKSAGSALTINSTTTPGTSGYLTFSGTAASENILCLFRLDSVTGETGNTNDHVHLQVNAVLSNSEYVSYTRLNYTANQIVLSGIFLGTPGTASVGESSTVAPAKWILVVSRADNASSAVATARHLRDQKMVSLQRDSTTPRTSSNAYFAVYVSNNNATASEIQSSEAHTFTLT